MIWQLDFWLLLILIGIAIFTLQVKDLLVSIVALGGYSFLMALLFAELGAVDVAFTEVVLGAGVVSVLLLVGLFYLERRPQD